MFIEWNMKFIQQVMSNLMIASSVLVMVAGIIIATIVVRNKKKSRFDKAILVMLAISLLASLLAVSSGLFWFNSELMATIATVSFYFQYLFVVLSTGLFIAELLTG